MEYITVENLKKSYTIYKRKKFKREKKEILALNGINLKIKKGEFLGYIGPNGAGKSTTIKILTGIMEPDSGNVKIDNFCPWKDRKKYVKNIGVVFGQKTQMWWDLPVIETYNLLKDIFKVKDFKNNLEYLIEKLNLSEILYHPVRQLSLGQRMRAEVGACMIHDPDILFLDEPTIGLDIISKENVNNFLKELNEKGKTIFLTTHDLKDIETLCNEVLVLNKGNIVYKGDVNNLKNITDMPTTMKIFLKSPPKDFKLIKELNGEYLKEKKEITLNIKSDGVAKIAEKIFKNYEVEDFKVTEPGIEEIIKEIYK
ncbi:ABC transporter ATP-binding protein [Tepiditoga spiralis]|uniref:ABC transporter ATP-binding protein n=1 Tax=Tepiditoga spiralis TaxID=2108365 RepID=A0A7G1G6I4_9BACT|nr:ATP-binding cassette domain-containing protein [Tepiditoga spiralis]BBE30487.1 ABC transporter ATP-binding protein [Tepiditoga spiralis]